MREDDPGKLADQHEREAGKLEQRGDELKNEVENVRQDWDRKRADAGVPGAPPPERDPSDEQDASGSPGAEAPPEGAGPSGAETPAEGAARPPADSDSS